MKKYRKRIGKSSYWPLAIVISLAFGLMVAATAFATGSSFSGQIGPQKAIVLTQVANHNKEAANGHHAAKYPISRSLSCPYTPQTGIFPYHEGDGFHENLINVAWAMSSQGVPYAIYAGALKNDPQQGVIFVLQFQKDPCATTGGAAEKVFTTPFHQGALKLVKIVGDTIAFTIANGGTGRFNYVTGKFL